MKKDKKIFDTIILIVEFSFFAFFAFLTYRLYYAITHRTPIPPAQQLDNDFVPLVLLFVLFVFACVFGLAFLTHISVRLIKKIIENKKAANRFD